MTETTEDIMTITRIQFDGLKLALESERRHTETAHAKIMGQRMQLRVLNEVILYRKRRMYRQQEFIRRVKALHKYIDLAGKRLCEECGTDWPCKTLAAGQEPKQ